MEDQPYPYDSQVHHEVLAKQAGTLMRRTKLERLNDMKRGLEVKLTEVNKAIELLTANPQINEIIEALERTGV